MPPLKLEVFTPEDIATPGIPAPESHNLAEQRLEEFERGYAAGWSDAVAARNGESDRYREELARHLQELSFSYYEARAHVLRGMSPFIGAVIGRFLPELAQRALPGLIAEALRPHLELASEAPVFIDVHPDNLAEVETVLGDGTPNPYRIRTDPALAQGKARLRLGDSETGVDTDAAIAAITTLITDFFAPAGKEQDNG